MKERRLAILLLALLITVFAFAGCGQTGNPGAEPPAPEKNQQTTPSEPDEGAEEEDENKGRGGPPEDRGGPPEDRGGGPPEG